MRGAGGRLGVVVVASCVSWWPVMVDSPDVAAAKRLLDEAQGRGFAFVAMGGRFHGARACGRSRSTWTASRRWALKVPGP